jgi:membrane protease YdiL (CAAX protease family)
MKKSNVVIYGILTTIFIAVISILIGRNYHLPFDILAESFESHSVMLLLSIIGIYYFSKQGLMRFPIEKFKFKRMWKPILVMIVAFVLVNILITLMLLPFETGSGNEMSEMMIGFGPVKVFLFVFIYASICEEFLFRGFLQNMLSPLKPRGITIFKIRISLPVLISAVFFGLSHMVWLFMGGDILFVIRLFILTTTLGLISGYFYEKYQNILYAIIIHATANFPPLIAIIVLK